MTNFEPATTVHDNFRMTFMPRMFGDQYFLNGEAMLFDFARNLMPDYAGGHWEFYHLRGSEVRYAVPTGRERWRVTVAGNYYDGEVSADAAGIILSLFAINAMSEFALRRNDWTGMDALADRYGDLRQYACGHPERAAILAAID
jgi:hypothetical protein